MEAHCAGMHDGIHMHGWTCATGGGGSIKCTSPCSAPYGGGGLALRLSNAPTRYVTHRGEGGGGADARAPAPCPIVACRSLQPLLLKPRTSPPPPPPASRAEAATAGEPAEERPFVLHRPTLTRSILPTRGTEGKSLPYVL